jgi:hypothetical protein
LDGEDLSPLLYISLNNENFNLSGKFPWTRALLYIFVKGEIIKGLLSFIIFV